MTVQDVYSPLEAQEIPGGDREYLLLYFMYPFETILRSPPYVAQNGH